MNKLAQFGIILSILLLGQVVQNHFQLPIPSTVIGMMLLLLLLIFKIIKLEWVEGVGQVLLDNLSLMFIPAGVGIMKELHIFKGQVIPILVTVVLTTLIVMVVTGYTVQALTGSKKD